MTKCENRSDEKRIFYGSQPPSDPKLGEVMIQVFIKHIVPLIDVQPAERMGGFLVEIGFPQLLGFPDIRFQAILFRFKIPCVLDQKSRAGRQVAFVGACPDNPLFNKRPDDQLHQNVVLFVDVFVD